MVERTENVTKRGAVNRYIVFEVTMSTNDTVVIDDLDAILDVALFALDDGLQDTVSFSTNVITLTQAGVTDKKYVGIALGI